MALHLPFRHSVQGVTGREANNAVPVAGIKEGDTLLAVVRHDAANGNITGLDPAAFTVGNGTIQSETLSTLPLALVIWADSP